MRARVCVYVLYRRTKDSYLPRPEFVVSPPRSPLRPCIIKYIISMLCEKKICYDDLDLTMNPIPFLLESTLGFDVSKIYGGFAVKPSLRLHCILYTVYCLTEI